MENKILYLDEPGMRDALDLLSSVQRQLWILRDKGYDLQGNIDRLMALRNSLTTISTPKEHRPIVLGDLVSRNSDLMSGTVTHVSRFEVHIVFGDPKTDPFYAGTVFYDVSDPGNARYIDCQDVSFVRRK